MGFYGIVPVHNTCFVELFEKICMLTKLPCFYHLFAEGFSVFLSIPFLLH